MYIVSFHDCRCVDVELLRFVSRIGEPVEFGVSALK
jgi:hypothetical protein